MHVYQCHTIAKTENNADIRLQYTYHAASFKQATDWVNEAMMDNETLVSVVRKDGRSEIKEEAEA